MNILITGGMGLIGSNLLKRLINKYISDDIYIVDNLWRGKIENIIIDNKPLIDLDKNFYNLDLTNYDNCLHVTKKIDSKWMTELCQDIEKYHKDKKIIIVCSGAIALGSNLIKKNKNLRKLEDKQAAASVGQIELAHQWRQSLKKYYHY